MVGSAVRDDGLVERRQQHAQHQANKNEQQLAFVRRDVRGRRGSLDGCLSQVVPP